MKKIGKNYTKDALVEKLRNHAFDIIIVSMAACLFCLMAHYKNTQKDICETKTEQIQKTAKIIKSSSQKSR